MEDRIEAIESRLDGLEKFYEQLAKRIEEVYVTTAQRWESHVRQLSKLDHKIEEQALQGGPDCTPIKAQWERELCYTKNGHLYDSTPDSTHIFCHRCGDLRPAKPAASHAFTPFKGDDFMYTSPDATGKKR